jgi:hypothetical protein
MTMHGDALPWFEDRLGADLHITFDDVPQSSRRSRPRRPSTVGAALRFQIRQAYARGFSSTSPVVRSREGHRYRGSRALPCQPWTKT